MAQLIEEKFQAMIAQQIHEDLSCDCGFRC